MILLKKTTLKSHVYSSHAAHRS